MSVYYFLDYYYLLYLLQIHLHCYLGMVYIIFQKYLKINIEVNGDNMLCILHTQLIYVYTMNAATFNEAKYKFHLFSLNYL